MSSGRRASSDASSNAARFDLLPLAAVVIWAGAALAVQRWFSWIGAVREGIRNAGFGADMSFYEVIARAAPSFPDQHVLRPYAERFPVHWLVGSLADVAGIGIHSLYRIAELVALSLLVAVVYWTLRRLELDAAGLALAAGVLIASAYPLHYLLAAPGMISDTVFMIGLAICLFGFVRGSLPLVLGGLVVAVLGRQTAVPVALAAALWVLLAPAWRTRRWSHAAAIALVPLGLWLALHFAADSFADPERGGLHDLTVLGFLTGPKSFAGHLGRIAIGIVVPCALVLGAWLRTRADLPWVALLLAAAVVVQPLVLGPESTGGNEARLAALSTPALAVAAGALLRRAQLAWWETALIAAAIFAGGLHHRYTDVGIDRPGWVALELIGALVILVVLARPSLIGERSTHAVSAP